jgi:Peptidase family M28
MLPVNGPRAEPGTSGGGAELEATLREVVERLAPLERTPCSPGEREAAEWLAERFRRIPGVEVALEDEPSWGIFPPTSAALGLLGVAAAALVLAGRRASGALLAVLSYAGVVDEAQNGPRILRRLIRRRRTTVNVLARTGGAGAAEGNGAVPSGGAGAELPTLVLLAHHDAPQTGVIFDQSLFKRTYEVAPQLIERFKTPPPQWWLGLAGPLCTLVAAATRRAGFARAALGTGALGSALVADVWRNATVPGANDNLSGVAALVALAEELSRQPVAGVRVLLASLGAEETLQDGVRAFIARHRHELPLERTWVINLDTVGSPHLVMLEAEGPVWMESYTGPWLRDLLASCAEQEGIELQRGYRARSSTDSVIPSRAGYPTATVVSVSDWRMPSNYHLPSDTPENLDYGTVADAARLTLAALRALASGAHGAPLTAAAPGAEPRR